MKNKLLLATDLDRTLLPNGIQEYDGTMPIFRDIVDKEDFCLAFVTGRSLELVKDAIEEFDTPVPDFIIADVGTNVYENKNGKFIPDKKWISYISSMTRKWDIGKFKKKLSPIDGIRIQERGKQGIFKLSYYLDDPSSEEQVLGKITEKIGSLCKDAIITYSFDERNKIGMIDILPRCATKLGGMEYLRKRLGLRKERMVYCGDSGNDLMALTSGYRSILVRNATREVRNAVKKSLGKKNLDKLYVSRSLGRLNGYYVSGIIEGLIKFGFISSDYAK
jgi:HAD superfamily hydrolase (TIGR01484 family)